MIRKILVLAVFLLLIAGVLLQHVYLDQTLDDLTADVQQICTAWEAGTYETAEKKAEALGKKWQKKRHSLSMLIEHEEMDMLHLEMLSLRTDIAIRNEQQVPGELARLLYDLQHIKGMDHFEWGNIL